MKTDSIQWFLALVASATAHAQAPDGGEDRRPPPVPPLFAALDTDLNGVLSADEITGAADALGKLDKNSDGDITLDELGMPPPLRPKDGEEPQNPPMNPPPQGMRPMPPVIAALDANRDGNISTQEMEAATVSLKALDKNGDGQLSPEEMRPQGPPPLDGGGGRRPNGPPPPPGGGEPE